MAPLATVIGDSSEPFGQSPKAVHDGSAGGSYLLYFARANDRTSVWDIHEKNLGLNHHKTAESLCDLANLLQEQGDLTGARQHFERALAVREEKLGPEHHKTAESLCDLASLLQEQGDLTGARQHFERALAIREKVLGPESEYTAGSLYKLAAVLREQGDSVAAQSLQERADAIEEEIGPLVTLTPINRKAKRKRKQTSKGRRKSKS